MIVDESNLPELTQRQEQILTLIVQTYTRTQDPVSSKSLVDSSDLGVSSATIRNEMAVLEELGYITAPHTSAGRIPSVEGYRYFVRQIMAEGDLTEAMRQRIANKFHAQPMATEPWMHAAATILARTAQSASLVTPPVSETSRFKHLELVSIQGRLVLMVLVLQGGVVHQRMLNLADSVPQTTLAEAAAHINQVCFDLYAQQIRLKSVQLALLEREVAELAAELMESVDNSHIRIYRDGLSDIIGNFPDDEGAAQAIRVFEERAFLDTILTELLGPLADDVRVIIAGDGREELSQLSMVLSRYGVPGQMSGAVGVFGPTHINYGRAIRTVRYVSSLMTNMLVGLYGEGEDLPGE